MNLIVLGDQAEQLEKAGFVMGGPEHLDPNEIYEDSAFVLGGPKYLDPNEFYEDSATALERILRGFSRDPGRTGGIGFHKPPSTVERVARALPETAGALGGGVIGERAANAMGGNTLIRALAALSGGTVGVLTADRIKNLWDKDQVE